MGLPASSADERRVVCVFIVLCKSAKKNVQNKSAKQMYNTKRGLLRVTKVCAGVYYRAFTTGMPLHPLTLGVLAITRLECTTQL